VAVALAVSLLPGVAETLEYDRSAVVEKAQWWRVVSAQLVHWNVRMALADLGVVLLLGVWAERTVPALTRALLLTGLPLIGIGIHLGLPGMQSYRGSSPIASALFVIVTLTVMLKAQSRSTRGLAIAALVLLVLKLLRESVTGEAFFAGPLPEGVVSVTGEAFFAGPLPEGVVAAPLTHLLGAGLGVAIVILGEFTWFRRRFQFGPPL
jgi:hypothetical protein